VAVSRPETPFFDMTESIGSPDQQRARRRQIFRLHRKLLRRIYDENDTRRDPSDDPTGDPRVAAWHCLAAFAGDERDVRLANRLLRRMELAPDYDFLTTALCNINARHRDRFEPDVCEKVDACLARIGPSQMASPGFVGMNDNFGAMAVLSLALAGEWTGRPERVRNACDKMRVLIARLDRDGTYAEFNSPTYTPITLACMADIVNYARTPELRELALRIEQQIWYDVCARFHPGIGQMGGPYSRAYTAGSCGHIYLVRFLMYVVFGPEICGLDPTEYAYGQNEAQVIHHNNVEFVASGGSWIASAEYHPPEACGRVMTDRSDPSEVRATASCAFVWQPDEWRVDPLDGSRERIRCFETYRYAPVLLTTYHARDWSLGTSSGAHTCGSGSQHDAFLLAYGRRRSGPGESITLDDGRTAWARYVFNGAQPGSALPSDLLPDQGRKCCVQQNGTAVVLYRPGIEVVRDITSMRVVIVMSLHRNEPDEIYLGADRLENLEGASEIPQPVFIRDGVMGIAFRPLALTDYGRPAAVTVRRVERFLTISFFNYEGPARSLNFPYQAPLFTRNGFVVEAATLDETGGFEAFRAAVTAGEIEDRIEGGLRKVAYRRGSVDLRIHYDPTDEGSIPPAWIGGKPREVPRFVATGLDALPWPIRAGC